MENLGYIYKNMIWSYCLHWVLGFIYYFYDSLKKFLYFLFEFFFNIYFYEILIKVTAAHNSECGKKIYKINCISKSKQTQIQLFNLNLNTNNNVMGHYSLQQSKFIQINIKHTYSQIQSILLIQKLWTTTKKKAHYWYY